MTEENPKRYDLEDRTLAFARAVRLLVKGLPKSISTIEDAKQLVRASGSIGANYIEANEALGKKDFAMKIKTAGGNRKRAAVGLISSRSKEISCRNAAASPPNPTN
ncbi:MAG TPA: four helix bundle protein [Chthoniobacterales bacterium]